MKCDGKIILKVRDDLLIYKEGENQVIMEWRSSQINDIIGDCIGYMLYNVAEYKDVDIFSKDNETENVSEENRKKQNVDLIYRALV